MEEGPCQRSNPGLRMLAGEDANWSFRKMNDGVEPVGLESLVATDPESLAAPDPELAAMAAVVTGGGLPR